MSENTTQETQSTEVSVAPPQLTWDTLNLAVQVIDLAFERRAFGGLSEIHVVLEVRNQIQKFVEYNRAAVEEEKAKRAAEQEAELAATKEKEEVAAVVGSTKKVAAKKSAAKSVKSK